MWHVSAACCNYLLKKLMVIIIFTSTSEFAYPNARSLFAPSPTRQFSNSPVRPFLTAMYRIYNRNTAKYALI